MNMLAATAGWIKNAQSLCFHSFLLDCKTDLLQICWILHNKFNFIIWKKHCDNLHTSWGINNQYWVRKTLYWHVVCGVTLRLTMFLEIKATVWELHLSLPTSNAKPTGTKKKVKVLCKLLLLVLKHKNVAGHHDSPAKMGIWIWFAFVPVGHLRPFLQPFYHSYLSKITPAMENPTIFNFWPLFHITKLIQFMQVMSKSTSSVFRGRL